MTQDDFIQHNPGAAAMSPQQPDNDRIQPLGVGWNEGLGACPDSRAND